MSTPSQNTFTRPARYGLLNPIRGAAALAVLVFHSFGNTAHLPIWSPMQWLRTSGMEGWLGVHIFFVVSGYCMTEKITALAGRGEGARHFLHDRCWRILPPYWATLLLILLISVLAAPFNRTGLTMVLPHGLPGLLGDFTLLNSGPLTPKLLLVAWTLGCEAVYYLVMALMLALWLRVGELRGVMILATVLAIVCAWPSAAEAGVIVRFWPEFWLGMVAYAALAWQRVRLGLFAVALVGALRLFHPFGFFGQIHGTSISTALALVALHQHDAKLMEWRPLRLLGWIGLWSYSLYLVHMPLLSRAQNLVGRWVQPEMPLFAIAWVACLLLTLVGCWLFYRYIEQPLENWRHALTKKHKAVALKPV